MNKAVLTSALLGLMMVGTAGTAKLMVPTHYLADTRSASKLEVIVPARELSSGKCSTGRFANTSRTVRITAS